MEPHVPQLFGSDCVSVHVALHKSCPAGHAPPSPASSPPPKPPPPPLAGPASALEPVPPSSPPLLPSPSSPPVPELLAPEPEPLLLPLEVLLELPVPELLPVLPPPEPEEPRIEKRRCCCSFRPSCRRSAPRTPHRGWRPSRAPRRCKRVVPPPSARQVLPPVHVNVSPLSEYGTQVSPPEQSEFEKQTA
jgi:hypothetical protein